MVNVKLLVADMDFACADRSSVLYCFLQSNCKAKTIKKGTNSPGGRGGGDLGMFWVGMCRPGLQIWTRF